MPGVNMPHKEQYWTEDQIVKLKELYSNTDSPLKLDVFAESIGKCKSNVCRKARQLGLKTNYSRSKGKLPIGQLSPGRKRRAELALMAPEEKKKDIHELLSYNAKQRIKEFGHPRDGKRVIRTCPACGVFFDVEASNPKTHCSMECARKELRPNRNTFSRGKSGRRADLSNQYFRSRYEANYARYLNLLIKNGEVVKWEYEPDTFWFEKIKRGVRSYTPDFKITFKGGAIEYHEVKGWDYPKGKTARKRMAKYYPKIKLVLIDAEFFKDARRKGWYKLIQGWETA